MLIFLGKKADQSTEQVVFLIVYLVHLVESFFTRAFVEFALIPPMLVPVQWNRPNLLAIVVTRNWMSLEKNISTIITCCWIYHHGQPSGCFINDKINFPGFILLAKCRTTVSQGQKQWRDCNLAVSYQSMVICFNSLTPVNIIMHNLSRIWPLFVLCFVLLWFGTTSFTIIYL